MRGRKKKNLLVILIKHFVFLLKLEEFLILQQVVPIRKIKEISKKFTRNLREIERKFLTGNGFFP